MTIPTFPATVRGVRAAAPGGGLIDLSWSVPESNSPITGYEVEVTLPDGVVETPYPTGSAVAGHRVRGLAILHRYGFRVRAVNAVGRGGFSDILHAVPQPEITLSASTVQRIPLLDLDRQSLIVRLGSVDCRLWVWWQPMDGAWYATLEAPTNTRVVSGRRIVVNSGLLDRLQGVLPGNVICRALDEDSALVDPTRNAWGRPTHGLFWEPE